MAQNRSNYSKYESRYDGGWITPAQFLAEVMCERFAKSKSQDLNPKFWEKQPWKKEFLKQLNLANRLVKEYDPALISRALRSSEGKKIFSLGYPNLKKLIDYEVYKNKEVHNKETEEAKKLPVKQVFIHKKSTLGKLKDLENE